MLHFHLEFLQYDRKTDKILLGFSESALTMKPYLTLELSSNEVFLGETVVFALFCLACICNIFYYTLQESLDNSKKE